MECQGSNLSGPRSKPAPSPLCYPTASLLALLLGVTCDWVWEYPLGCFWDATWVGHMQGREGICTDRVSPVFPRPPHAGPPSSDKEPRTQAQGLSLILELLSHGLSQAPTHLLVVVCAYCQATLWPYVLATHGRWFLRALFTGSL